MSFRCPACKKPLYNRRRDRCESCGSSVPEAHRLSQKQRQFLDDLKTRETREHRAFMERDLPGSDSSPDISIGF
jgi:hypothetical protein